MNEKTVAVLRIVDGRGMEDIRVFDCWQSAVDAVMAVVERNYGDDVRKNARESLETFSKWTDEVNVIRYTIGICKVEGC